MRYYIDCEFNGFGGELLSFAIVSETGSSLYLALPFHTLQQMTDDGKIDQWVLENVLPFISLQNATPKEIERQAWPLEVQRFLQHDTDISIVADWPEDISHFMNLLMLAPGRMVRLPAITIELRRVDAYFTNLPGAVRHNALWDARSLRHLYVSEAGSTPRKATS